MSILKTPQPLSKREYEILELVSKGFNYKEIALHIFVSPVTVRTHLKNIYKKLGAHNKLQAIDHLKNTTNAVLI